MNYKGVELKKLDATEDEHGLFCGGCYFESKRECPCQTLDDDFWKCFADNSIYVEVIK